MRHLLAYSLAALLVAFTTIDTFFPAAAAPRQAPAETPIAERRFADWLAAFNSGDRDTVRTFVTTQFLPPPGGTASSLEPLADQFLKAHKETGGLELRRFTARSPESVTALCTGKSTGYWMQIKLPVEADPPDYRPKAPYRLAGIGLDFVAPPTDLIEKRRLPDDEIRDRTARLMDYLSRADLFSGTVLIARGDKVLFKSAHGPASRAWNIPNRTDTRFHLASITKMFTAVAVASLVDKGKLQYTTKVGEVLADYPNRRVADEVTVQQLLSHTSGMRDRMEWMESALRSPKLRTIPAFVETFANDPLEVEPGTQFNYSNAGYILLGAMIEKLTSQDYYTAVRERVFKPAGMNDTDFFELDASTPNLAEGYADAPGGAGGTRVHNVLLLGAKGMPAGGAYGTADDLLRFGAALRAGKLVKPETLRRMWTGVNVPGHDDGAYGYGFELGAFNGVRAAGHGGGWSGITNLFEMMPDQGATIVILSNYDTNPAAIAHKLREWLTQNPNNVIPVPPAFAVPGVSLSPKAPRVGEAVSITVTVNNAGGLARGTLVDCEVTDAAGKRVHQQFTDGQRFEPRATRTYTYSWTPKELGAYRIDVGVFGPGWSPKYRFDYSVVKVEVR